jgi:hypothetical protein
MLVSTPTFSITLTATNAMRFEEDAMDEPFDDEEEPFMLRERSDVEDLRDAFILRRR